MPFELIKDKLNGLKLIKPKVFSDDRGFFMETYKENELNEYGIPTSFVQENHSRSQKGVIRGLHFQFDPPQGKLIRVTRGKAFVVELDIRPSSPTFGQHFAVELSEENHLQLWVPAGFANGFCTLSDEVDVQYKCTDYWNPEGESNILWNDPELGIEWPIKDPIVSPRDRYAPTLSTWMENAKKYIADGKYFD